MNRLRQNSLRVPPRRILPWPQVMFAVGALIACFGTSFGGLPCTVSAQSTQFPYQAMVLRDGVVARSGPGANHYSTDELQQNAIVEIWRHDPDGWMAIRPPAGSFSMIPESAIELVHVPDGGKTDFDNDANPLDALIQTLQSARVVADLTQVWVGTRTGPVENPLWQVKLRKGEEVVVLGSTSWPSPEGVTVTWLQIAPPAGEFRWVHRNDLQLPDQRLNSVGEIQQVNWLADPFGDLQDPALNSPRNSNPQRPTRRSSPESTELMISESPTDNSGWRRATRPMSVATNPSPNPQSSAPVARVADLSATTPGILRDNNFNFGNNIGNSPNRLNQGDSSVSTPSDLQSQPIASPLTTVLADRLGQLDNQISMEIIKPAENWELPRLIDQLVQIQATATTEQEKQQSLWLQSKLEQLRLTQQRLLGTPGLNTSGLRSNVGLPPVTGSGVDSTVQNGSIYDAYGWLNEFHQDHGRGPAGYVLQDDQGRITHHLTPSPGLNLNRYLKSKIGVIGRRGYNQKLKLSHVAVDTVVVLEKR